MKKKKLSEIIITIDELGEGQGKRRNINIKLSGSMSQFEVIGALEYAKTYVLSVKPEEILIDKDLDNKYIG